MSKYVLGKKGVLDNIKQNKISTVYLKHDFPELLELKKKINFNICYKKDNNFYSVFDGNHQFVIGELKENNFYNNLNSFISDINSINSEKKIIIMLDGIQDPGNFGAIIRTCSCFGVDGIIYKKMNQVQINDTVIKTSVGAISHVKMLSVSNLSNIIMKLKELGYWVLSSCLDDKSVDLNSSKLDFEKICLILGNENNGISKVVLDNSDLKLKIPMSIGSVQSLNVSVSLGILLYAIIYK